MATRQDCAPEPKGAHTGDLSAATPEELMSQPAPKGGTFNFAPPNWLFNQSVLTFNTLNTFQLLDHFRPRRLRRADRDGLDGERAALLWGHVVVVGMGQVGLRLCQLLRRCGAPNALRLSPRRRRASPL